MERDQEFGKMLKMVFLVVFVGQGACENDRDFKLCGTWLHGDGPQTLAYNLTTGCENVTISADGSSLSVQGKITARCQQSGVRSLNLSSSRDRSHFCVFWEPLLDLLQVELDGRNNTLCGPYGLQGSCCTDLSSAVHQMQTARYGIRNISIKGDFVPGVLRAGYVFYGQGINCKEEFCEEASQSSEVNIVEDAVLRSQALGSVQLPCAQGSVVEMDEGFKGHNVILPAPPNVPLKMIPSVHLPSCLKRKKKAKVVCIYYKNSTLFLPKRFWEKLEGDSRILEDVVGISVENEVIANLSEPIRISFHHSDIPDNYTRTCVSWDTKKDPKQAMWKPEGCVTVETSLVETECHCNHLTYFAILVQVAQRPTVRHLKALTYTTAVCCAISIVSCVILLVWLIKQRPKRHDTKYTFFLGRCGLTVALFLLYVFFVLSGFLANVREGSMCPYVGAMMHYALLCSFSWMAMVVLHAFWLIQMVLSRHDLPSNPWVWYLCGFGVPVLPVGILARMNDIYGLRKIVPSDDVTNPYRMCWMMDSDEAWLAHYITNVGSVSVVVCAGAVMLFLVLKAGVQVRKTQDKKQKSPVTLLGTWGLSCLFGTTWVLSFLDFSENVIFLICVFNALQGFFILLWHVLEHWWKRAKSNMRSSTGSTTGSSTGSTVQYMLQEQEKS